MSISIIFTVLVILQTLVSGAMSQEIADVLVPSPNSPIATSSGVYGSLQCTKNSDESYAVCASRSNAAIKYNLQPFSFAATGPDQGSHMVSCDLYETDSQSTSLVVCVRGTFHAEKGVVLFHRVSDMALTSTVAIGRTQHCPRVIIDTPNQIAYVSTGYNIFQPVGDASPAIFKVMSIGSSTPFVAATLTSFGSSDLHPAAMIIIDGFLYVHFNMDQMGTHIDPAARLARINVSTFTWNQTITFASEESYGTYDNLVHDNNFIYDLTYSGILVRCTYKNNKFARFDSLNTGLSWTSFLAISPDLRTLFVSNNANSLLHIVDVSSFSLFGNAVSVPNAFGRPIVTSSRNVYAFSENSDLVYAFQYSNQREFYSLLTKIMGISEFVVLVGCILFPIVLFFFCMR